MTSLPPIPALIEDYALLSDRRSAALVSRAGSVDWLCWPRFDSGACFAALLGEAQNGRWQICPDGEPTAIRRAYRDGSMVVETVFETATGRVAVIDFMALGVEGSTLVRIVEGRQGVVEMRLWLTLRFDYGSIVPWVTRLEDDGLPGLVAIAGPDLVVLRGPIKLEGEGLQSVGRFSVSVGERVRFQMRHGPSHLPPPPPVDCDAALAATDTAWREWSGRCASDGEFEDLVKRSLITLKALSFAPTGGIVAAPTTSLPETLGGARNWDYRYCWLRDASMTLYALMDAGYYNEAEAWVAWLHRSIAGAATQVQIMYGVAGERRLDEYEIPWLRGYEGAAPVRVGNLAAGQVQLDVYGEVMASMRQARRGGIALPQAAWALQHNLLDHLLKIWRDPDEGMWEVRGGRRQFTFSKMMAWLAFDCAIKDAEQFGLEGDVAVWRAARAEIHALVCARGFSARRQSFVQCLDGERLDASLLLIASIGFLPAHDPRVTATITAIERNLMRDGLVLRYEPDPALDGQHGDEGAFLACSFWMVGSLAQTGQVARARALFKRLTALANDVGLLAEEYDFRRQRQVGNFPQALSHLGLVIAAARLRSAEREAERAEEKAAAGAR